MHIILDVSEVVPLGYWNTRLIQQKTPLLFLIILSGFGSAYDYSETSDKCPLREAPLVSMQAHVGRAGPVLMTEPDQGRGDKGCPSAPAAA